MDTGPRVNIFGNEQADNFTKVRNSPQLSNSLTLTDADIIARRRLNISKFGYQLAGALSRTKQQEQCHHDPKYLLPSEE
ncbi:hypothetical protein TNCV_2377841 [Trichonephila clavipes]|nr:hypothetical protein TNCV_2377841 [Trichonephila clavipes]